MCCSDTPLHDDALLAAEGATDQQRRRRDAHGRFGFAAWPLTSTLPRVAGLLRFRSRLEQTRDVEPDVEPHAGRIGIGHRRLKRGQADQYADVVIGGGREQRSRVVVGGVQERQPFVLPALTEALEHRAIAFEPDQRSPRGARERVREHSARVCAARTAGCAQAHAGSVEASSNVRRASADTRRRSTRDARCGRRPSCRRSARRPRRR